MNGMIYQTLQAKKKSGKKSFAVLVDPDKTPISKAHTLIDHLATSAVDYIMVGGSLLLSDHLDELVRLFKKECELPVILFPGSPAQVTPYADALLYLSMISGRNPDLLIGQHVTSAPIVRKSGLEILPTGYMIIDGGAPTTVSYISNTTPIPSDKNDIALCTAVAGEMLGMKLIYMDSGSGARNAVPEAMIGKVSAEISIPLIVGGGIRTAEQAYRSSKAGADLIVVGNAIEKDPGLILDISSAIKSVPELTKD